jgi:hypothetical protein
MAKRFESTFFAADNPFSTQWLIEVWDEDFVGTAEEIELDFGQTLRWSASSEDRHASIRGSELKFNFVIDSTDQLQFIYDLQISKEGRFTVVLKQTVSETRFWAGVILPDISSYQDKDKIVYTVTATDGIAALRKIEYRPTPTTFYSGKASFVDHILNCLNKLSFVSVHWTNSEAFLYTVVDWWEATMTRADGNDPMALSAVDHANYYRFEKGDQKALSCLEVLEDILKGFGCYIRQADGGFWVEQVSRRQLAGYVSRNYDYQGNYITNTTYSTINQVNNTSPGSTLRWKSFVNYDYYPGLLKSVVNFDTYQRRNYLAGATIDEDNTSFSVTNPLYKATDGTVLRLRMAIRHSVKNLSYTGGANTPIYLKFQGTLKIEQIGVESNYWRRAGYFQPFSYQIVYTPNAAGLWVGTFASPNTFDVLGMIGGVPPTGLTTTNVTMVDQDLPPLEIDGNKISFDFDFVEFRDAQNSIINPAQLELHWTVDDLYLGTYTDGVQTTVSDVDTYEIDNDEEAFSEVSEITTSIGTSNDINTIGAIFVDDSGDWILGGQWGEGATVAGDQIGFVLARAVLAGQLLPIKKINATARGVFNVRRLFEWGNSDDPSRVLYLFHSGEWALDSNELSGLFHEMEYGTSFTTTPIKRKKKLVIDPGGNTTFPSTNPGGNSNNQPGFATNNDVPNGTTLTPVADAFTGVEITAGEQTSIDIRTNIYAGQFITGQYINVTNPLTGAYETLTVTADSEDGDTSIAVNGGLNADYPPSSTVASVRDFGIYGLPKGVFGDVLTHDGTRWRRGDIGTILTTTLPYCVSDEDAVDNYGVAVYGWYIAAAGHFGVKPGTLTSVMPS